MVVQYPIQKQYKRVSAAATNEEIETERVESGKRWELSHVSMVDETTASTKFRVLVRGHGQDHLLLEQDNPGADELVWHDRPLLVPEGCWLVFQFTGTTSSDVLRAFLEGEEIVADA